MEDNPESKGTKQRIHCAACGEALLGLSLPEVFSTYRFVDGEYQLIMYHAKCLEIKAKGVAG